MASLHSAHATERTERSVRRPQIAEDEDKVEETEISLTVGRRDDTAETNTARKTIMITTRRHGWFIGTASFGTNSSAFRWTAQWRRLSTFRFCPLVRQNAELLRDSLV